MAPRVSVNSNLCIGSGDCAQLAPEAFEIDEAQQVAVVRAGAATASTELLVRAARSCPTQAIEVTDDDGSVLYEGG